MNITTFNPPTKNDKGIYVFSNPIERMYDSIHVSSVQEYLERQERILKATQTIVDDLTARQLADGVEGDVEVMFRLWNANKHIFGKGKVGELGFPNFSIQTDYGQSDLYLWPAESGITLQVHGRGIAEETVKSLQGNLESIFSASDSRLEVYEGHQRAGFLTARLFVPEHR